MKEINILTKKIVQIVLNYIDGNHINKIYFLFSFNNGNTVRVIFRNKGNLITNIYYYCKEYFDITEAKILKKSLDIVRGINKELREQYSNNTDTTSPTHPKHIRVTYDVKTEKMEVETSFVSESDFLKPSEPWIYEQWLEELKSGKKDPNGTFYKDPTKPKYYFDYDRKQFLLVANKEANEAKKLARANKPKIK